MMTWDEAEERAKQLDANARRERVALECLGHLMRTTVMSTDIRDMADDAVAYADALIAALDRDIE